MSGELEASAALDAACALVGPACVQQAPDLLVSSPGSSLTWPHPRLSPVLALTRQHRRPTQPCNKRRFTGPARRAGPAKPGCPSRPVSGPSEGGGCVQQGWLCGPLWATVWAIVGHCVGHCGRPGAPLKQHHAAILPLKHAAWINPSLVSCADKIAQVGTGLLMAVIGHCKDVFHWIM